MTFPARGSRPGPRSQGLRPLRYHPHAPSAPPFADPSGDTPQTPLSREACGPSPARCGQSRYSSKVQQRALTATSTSFRPHPALAGTADERPEAPLVRDEEAVPAACPIGWSIPGTYGHSRIDRYVGSPADGQADPLRIPTCDETWGPQPGARQRRRSRLTGGPVKCGEGQAAWPGLSGGGGGGAPLPGGVTVTCRPRRARAFWW
jgi:hypothetical protein